MAVTHFDWRDNGGNYVTTVKDQGITNTCWAFCACACVEAKWAITNNITGPMLQLSVQNLICAGGMGDIVNGGWEDRALTYAFTNGIVDEATLPFTHSNYSSLWPLRSPHDVYKATSVSTYYTNSSMTLAQRNSATKSHLDNNGTVACAIDAYTDFFTPASPPVYSSFVGDGLQILSVPERVSYAVPDHIMLGHPQSVGAVGDDAYINHAVLITGYTTDPSVDSGGYYHIKNSWGTGWGVYGYGFCTFDSIERHCRLHVLDGGNGDFGGGGGGDGGGKITPEHKDGSEEIDEGTTVWAKQRFFKFIYPGPNGYRH